MEFTSLLTDLLKDIPGFGMLVTFIALDIISGLSVAAGKGKWNSSVSRKGLSRKVQILCLFGCALAIEHWVPGSPPMSAMAALFLSIGEVLSILENADDLGIWIPPALKRWMRERRVLTAKQLDKAIAVITPTLNAEYVEVTTKRMDSHAEHVEQHASMVDVKTDATVIRKRDSDPDISRPKG